MREEPDTDEPKETISVTSSAESPGRTIHMAINKLLGNQRDVHSVTREACFGTSAWHHHMICYCNMHLLCHLFYLTISPRNNFKNLLDFDLFLEEFYKQNITPTISPCGDLPQHTNYPTIYLTELKNEILYSHIWCSILLFDSSLL